MVTSCAHGHSKSITIVSFWSIGQLTIFMLDSTLQSNHKQAYNAAKLSEGNGDINLKKNKIKYECSG